MISYFKFTDGGDFTLNGSSYSGLINVVDSDVYTGSVFTSDSKKLSSTGTFLSKCFQDKLNFNYSAGTLLKDQIQQVSIQPRSILSVDLLKETLDILADNNTKIFASGVRLDNKFLNPLYRPLSGQTFVNCITSITNPVLKSIRLPLFKIPLRFALESNTRGFKQVFSQTSNKGSIFLTDGLSGFKYFNNGGAVTGFSNSVSALTFGQGYNINADFFHTYLHYDRHTDLLYQTNAQNFSIFNINYTAPIPRVFLQDIIDVTTSNSYVSVYNVVYGRNFRSVLVETGSDIAIEVYRLNDNNRIALLPRIELGFKTITNICQRFEDDLLIVVGTDVSGFAAFATFDIEEILNGNNTPASFVVTSIPIVATYGECADFDSDIVIFKKYNDLNYLESIEYRSISSPNYPLAQFKSTFDDIVKVNDIVSTMSTDLSADYTIIGSFYKNYNEYFINMQHSTSNVINTLTITDRSLTVDTKTMYTYLLSKNLKQNYINELESTRNSSIGLTLNGTLQKIIQDTLLIYYNFCQKFEFSGSVPSYTVSILLRALNLDDLLLYSNESVNIATLNRIINTILEVQNTIANELS